MQQETEADIEKMHWMRLRSVDSAKDTLKSGKSKIERYGWRPPIDQPGEFLWLDKTVIKVDNENYQRNPKGATVVTKIAADWSWVACGAIAVALRDDGNYYAMDGQHRLLAALRREDIRQMPCMVFLVSKVEEEAQGFLRVNTGRKPLSGIERFRAKVTSGNPVTMKVDHLLRLYGYRVTDSTDSKHGVKCVTLLTALAERDADALRAVLMIYRDAFDSRAVREKVAAAIAEIYFRRAADVNSKRFVQRCAAVGHSAISEAVNKAAAYYARGGARVFAEGAANALNKGLRSPIVDVEKFAANKPE
jgi:hypothetical protein